MKRKSFKILVILAVNIAILGLLELSLRVAGFARPWERPDPFNGFCGNYRVYGVEAPCPGITVYRTNPNKLGTFQLETFAVRKPAGTVRVFCLGGSTVNGGVYRETYARVLKLLAFREPWGKRVEIINAGGNGYDSAQIAHLARELVQYQPDVLVVVTGHNEFSSLRYQSGLLSQGPALRSARVFLDGFRLTHLVRSLAGRGGDARVVFDFKPPGGPVTAAERETIVNRMGDNLHRLSDLAKKHRITLVLGVAASNLKYEPVGDTGDAPGAFRRAADLRDRGMTDEALSVYREALTGDDVPKRIVPAQQQCIRQIGERLSIPVVDFQRLFEQHAADGIPGDDLFLDFCHPNFEGNIIMARAVRDVLKSLPSPAPVGEGLGGEGPDAGGLVSAGQGAGGLAGSGRDCAEMTTEPSCLPGACPFTGKLASAPQDLDRAELETAVEQGFGLEALAASVKLAGLPGYTGSDVLQRWFDSSDFVTLKQLFLKRAGCLELVVVPVLLDALEERYFAFDARQALLRLTGEHFGLRSYQPSSGGAQWRRWWKSITLKRKRLLVRKNLQKVVKRLNSDDLNVRLAAIAILEEFTGTTLGYDPLALQAEREATVEQWQKMWRDLTAVKPD